MNKIRVNHYLSQLLAYIHQIFLLVKDKIRFISSWLISIFDVNTAILCILSTSSIICLKKYILQLISPCILHLLYLSLLLCFHNL